MREETWRLKIRFESAGSEVSAQEQLGLALAIRCLSYRTSTNRSDRCNPRVVIYQPGVLFLRPAGRPSNNGSPSVISCQQALGPTNACRNGRASRR
jgi:hypothetical protein